jgi:PAS domain-containing protein
VSCRFRRLRLRDKKFANPRSPWYSTMEPRAKCWAMRLLDREGKVRGAIGVFVEITEHKRAEEALQQSQAALARVARIVTIYG